jgi:hypothetical protein
MKNWFRRWMMMNRQNSQDAILWIGQSYARILCEKAPEACYFDARQFPRRCFVHEAEFRGCCRKVPKAPDWLLLGESRVFLIHRDGQEDRARGCIFGYFVLKRFELIVDDTTYMTVTREDQMPWMEATYREIEQAVLDEIEEEEIIRESPEEYTEKLTELAREQFDKQWSRDFQRRINKGAGVNPRRRPSYSPTAHTSPEPEMDSDTYDLLEELIEELVEELLEELLESDVIPQRHAMPDSELLRGYKEKLKKRAQEQLARRRAKDFQRQEGSDIHDLLRRQIEELTARLLESDETLQKHRAQDSDRTNAFIPLRVAVRETHRSCSKRLKPGAMYLVDALAAEITDAFIKRLAGGMSATIREGEDLFDKTVRDVRKAHKKGTLTKIYPGLEGYTVLHGELALFSEPYPVFERRPQAAFRGLLRVNGDRLLEEIRKSYESTGARAIPKIPYWCKEVGPWTPARLAEKFGFTKTYASALLQLYGDVLKDLGPEKSLDLPFIGRFTIENDELHFTPLDRVTRL